MLFGHLTQNRAFFRSRFSPWGMPFRRFSSSFPFFRSLFGPVGMLSGD